MPPTRSISGIALAPGNNMRLLDTAKINLVNDCSWMRLQPASAVRGAERQPPGPLAAASAAAFATQTWS